jgi:hypothetical protein
MATLDGGRFNGPRNRPYVQSLGFHDTDFSRILQGVRV